MLLSMLVRTSCAQVGMAISIQYCVDTTLIGIMLYASWFKSQLWTLMYLKHLHVLRISDLVSQNQNEASSYGEKAAK